MKGVFSASYALDQQPERNAPAADKGCRDSAQEGEKDGTAEAEPPFFTKIIAAGSSAPKHNHQDPVSYTHLTLPTTSRV